MRLFVGLALGLLYIALSFFLNEKNTTILSSFHSELSDEEKEAFPYASMLGMFKKLYLYFGIGIFGIVILLSFFGMSIDTFVGFVLVVTIIEFFAVGYLAFRKIALVQ
jgi:uncharacterized membrane protein